jgi:hypothetical protein
VEAARHSERKRDRRDGTGGGSRPAPSQKNMASQDLSIKVKADTVEILRFPGTFSAGKYPRPKPFGGMGKAVDENGFTDHFPIGAQITEAD